MAAPEGRAVHDVVVDEGEGVKNLQAGGRFQNLPGERIGINSIGGEAEFGADALASDGYHVTERVVQAFRFVLKADILKKGGRFPADEGFLNHVCNFAQR